MPSISPSPLGSVRVGRRTLLGAAAGIGALALAGCSPAAQSNSGSTGGAATVTVRLWDQQVQAAYETGFAAFTAKNPGIKVTTTLVPWANYFTKLQADVGGGNADDIWLMNGAYIQTYITNKSIIPIGDDFSSQKSGWIQPAIDQYTSNGNLWGVPQLTDGGIAIYYNKSLLDAAGVSVAQIRDLSWVPGGGSGDTFLPIVQKLTLDANGKRGNEPGFDGTKPQIWGYSAAQDLQGIYYNFLGSNGGSFQAADDTFNFNSPQGVEAFQYIVDLINKYQVSPAAGNTNANGDFTRDQFLQGKIALFQSGVYNLKDVFDGAKFEWGLVPIPAGPAGRISVVNNTVVVGNAKSKNSAATLKVLQWLGSVEGASFVGKAGAALPAVSGAQDAFKQFWAAKKVDPSQFARQGAQKSIGAPTGSHYGAAASAWKPYFDAMFLGRTPVATALSQAQDAANKALQD
ncbi:multiple sugar transport system substrate-binding protein [Propionibacterium cyclohexanicum]|uniref:Multiple sugar transport system substrate-binding protein n=1 Tax=Propionibacterium cyclohexanicum TaxID=64702 RepID=A0A1H9SLU8_9ACTN|nr:sugar ABC transporter substrate-binding protein [Propionibacterium cyclohexanicum]SER85990.1 multiple sugar transport system substrate-binding protein [Propionibacterium cyclohexanicum]